MLHPNCGRQPKSFWQTLDTKKSHSVYESKEGYMYFNENTDMFDSWERW